MPRLPFRIVSVFTPVVAIAALCLAAGPAAADAIDGNWCSSDGRHMSINGPNIVTPGGTRMTGDYERHGFRYKVPKREKPAGSQVDMVLVDDDTLRVKVGKGPTKTWRRCKTVS